MKLFVTFYTGGVDESLQEMEQNVQRSFGDNDHKQAQGLGNIYSGRLLKVMF